MEKPEITIYGSVRERLVGTWQLVVYRRVLASGETIYPWGEQIDGRLTYTPEGHLSVQQMRLGRPAFASGNGWEGTPAEIEAAFRGYLAYCGRFQVDEREGTVDHLVECCQLPHWLGLTLKRFYSFEDDRLTLTSPPMPDGSRFSLTWQRLT